MDQIKWNVHLQKLESPQSTWMPNKIICLHSNFDLCERIEVWIWGPFNLCGWIFRPLKELASCFSCVASKPCLPWFVAGQLCLACLKRTNSNANFILIIRLKVVKGNWVWNLFQIVWLTFGIPYSQSFLVQANVPLIRP